MSLSLLNLFDLVAKFRKTVAFENLKKLVNKDASDILIYASFDGLENKNPPLEEDSPIES